MSSPQPTPVGKPANAGSGQVAIAQTTSAFINIRNGPGTQFRDIGDLRDNTLVLHFPATQRPDGWVWIEQRGTNGWVSSGVVKFEPAVGNIPTNQTPTPYDGSVAIWHWKGNNIPEKSIEELVANLKRRAPNVRQIWVKTSDGVSWQGRFDAGGGNMMVNGPADVQRWVQVLQQNGLEFHAWCVPQGLNVEAEATVIADACRVAGVRSMVLDVEPYTGFWQGGREAVRPFMLRLRQLVGGRFHIAMSMDPRPQHRNSIFPEEWFPFVNSIHPQTYWQTFRGTPEGEIQRMLDTWKDYGKPIIPAFQGDAPVEEQREAHTLATQRYGMLGVSWWRYGVISQFEAINRTITLVPPNRPIENPSDIFADEIIIVPKGKGFRSGSYTGRNEFNEFIGTWGWPILWKPTEATTSKVWAEWKADIPQDGRYEISVFVAAAHSTTQRARYKIHGVKGTNTEVVVDLNQAITRNVWVTLGVFDLVKGAPNVGKVALNDVTGETGREIGFNAVRFRRIISVPANPAPNPTPPAAGDWVINGVFITDGYDSPVGTAQQRADARLWPSGWRDATGFGANTDAGYRARFGYHTGVDLNFGAGGNDDIGQPVYSIASGVVIYQAELRPWGNLTIIRHDPLRGVNGTVVYSRYGHMQNLRVQVGQRVRRGTQIGEIGTGGGRFIAHLHFDIVITNILERAPGDWPGQDLPRLLRNYVNPLDFTRANRPLPR
jgi:murein DD-endopeptidase MepM/ murein hydrolase activator NlpD/uncharacterized protein YraI